MSSTVAWTALNQLQEEKIRERTAAETEIAKLQAKISQLNQEIRELAQAKTVV